MQTTRMSDEMLTISDIFTIYDRIHFCKGEFRHVCRTSYVWYDDPINGKDIKYKFDHFYTKPWDDLHHFYETGGMFIDGILAGHLGYFARAAEDTFDFITYSHRRDEFEDYFPDPKSREGNFTEEQLRFALEVCEDELKEYYTDRRMNIHLQAVDFLLNCILDTGKYSLEDQMIILMDDAYIEYLEENGYGHYR